MLALWILHNHFLHSTCHVMSAAKRLCFVCSILLPHGVHVTEYGGKKLVAHGPDVQAKAVVTALFLFFACVRGFLP